MDPQLAIILQLLQQQQNPAASSISGLATNTGVNALNNAQNPSLGFPSGGSLAPTASTNTQTAPVAPTPTFNQPASLPPKPTTQPVTSPGINSGMLAASPFQQPDSGLLAQSPLGTPLGQALPTSLTQSLFGAGGSSLSPTQAFQFATS